MQKLALGAIRLYQAVLSPYWKGYCRHTPSCSNYSHQAISRHGAFKGIRLTLMRLGRCRPLGTRGYDPVP